VGSRPKNLWASIGAEAIGDGSVAPGAGRSAQITFGERAGEEAT
jgi:hypothetical protein